MKYGERFIREQKPTIPDIRMYRMLAHRFDDEDLMPYKFPLIRMNDDDIRWNVPKSDVEKIEMFNILYKEFGVVMPWNGGNNEM